MRGRRGLRHSTAVHRADLASTASGTMQLSQVCGAGVCRHVLPANAACGGYDCFRRLVDGHVRICHGAFVGVSLAGLWLWRWLGCIEMHRCQHAVVSCMEAVAFLLLAVAQSMLHATCCNAACIMLHAACCMMHLARKASGSTWCAEGTSPISHVASRLLCVGAAEDSLRWSCRTCQ